MVRDDMPDVVFKTKREKFNAVVEEIQARNETGQPILVGTISIETSEMLSKKLKKHGIKHNVLNAKKHEREAEIVAQAGRKHALTISTNMAGRGTDIVLGGNPELMALGKCNHDKEHADYLGWLAKHEAQCAEEQREVLEAGGLHILGTERHESRRIDNQLRGRSGRQGDPGSSQFFLSLEDDLLRIFEADRVAQWWDRVGVEEGEAIENRMLTRVIEGAQKKVEARNFDMRKHLLDYDDVMNKQRQAFYGRRRTALEADDVHLEVEDIIEGLVVQVLELNWPPKGDPEEDQFREMATSLEHYFGVAFALDQPPFLGSGEGYSKGGTPSDRDVFGRAIYGRLVETLNAKRAECDRLAEEHADSGYPNFAWFERDIMLRILDSQWKDHLHSMDGLREGIGLRGYAQKDPKVEYQREGFDLFGATEERIDEQVAEILFKFQLPEPRAVAAPASSESEAAAPQGRPQAGSAIVRQSGAAGAAAAKPGKVGRNDACPCGSGKKYKKCCGA
jgi:preprotein translocase subunit SecA